MKALLIAFKIIKQNLKQPVSLFIFIAMPIIFMLIMGTALSGAFSSEGELPPLSVAYYISKPGIFARAFSEFIQQVPEVASQQVLDEKEGVERLKQGDFQSFIVIDAVAGKINLYLNNTSGIAAGIIEGLIQGFVQEYQYIEVVIKNSNGQNVNIKDIANTDFVSNKILGKPRQPDSMDNMGILFMTMFILFSAFASAYTIEEEKNNLTYFRIFAAPVSKSAMIGGVFLGNLTAAFVEVLVVFVLAKYFVGVYFGENIGLVLILLFSEVFLATAIGVGLGTMLKDPKAVKGIGNTLILFFVFISGGYGPVPDVPFFNVAKNFSPITWVKKSLFEIIYSGTLHYLLPALLICLLCGIILMLLAIIAINRREEL